MRMKPKHAPIAVLALMTSGCAGTITLDQTPAELDQQGVALQITSEGIAGSAQENNKELSEYNDASILLFAQNSRTGHGVSTLAPPGHTGNSRSEIRLPEGWRLTTAVVPGGGCTLKPTHLYNEGSGAYTLSVMTISAYGPCPWLRGEYAYRLTIVGGGFAGGTVGKIVIE